MTQRPKNLTAEARRGMTVEAVIELAATRNPSDITTAAIAQHMQLTQGALFRHFPSKDAIWHAVMESVKERLLDRIDRTAEGLQSPLAILRAVFMAHVEFVSEHPGVPRMLFGELQRSDATAAKRTVQSLIESYARRLHTWIEAGKAQGELAEDTDSEAAGALFIGAIQGLVMQSMLANDLGHLRRDAPRVFMIFRRGVEIRHEQT